MWDIELNCDLFWLCGKFCREWFVASGQAGSFCLLFFSILNFVYGRHGGKGRASLFIPVELSLTSIQVLLLLPSFFPLFCLSFFLLLLYNTMFLLLCPFAHWMQSLRADSLTATVYCFPLSTWWHNGATIFWRQRQCVQVKAISSIWNSCSSI